LLDLEQSAPLLRLEPHARYTRSKEEQVTLTLEITASSVGSPGSPIHVFSQQGGTIGRANSSSWVLPHGTVSLHHALITWEDGVFYIRDTESRNGVAINSPESELIPNKPYPLKTGDRIYIEPYEIRVLIDAPEQHRSPFADEFLDDPLTPQSVSSMPAVGPLAKAGGHDELDPLKYLDPVPPSKPGRKKEKAPKLADDPLDAYYVPPPMAPVPSPPDPPNDAIPPPGWDPLATPAPRSAPPAPAIRPVRPRVAPDRVPPRKPPSPFADDASSDATGQFLPPEVVRPTGPAPAIPVEPVRVPSQEIAGPAADLDLSALLAGAGIPTAALTPELARTLGKILRVVVSGLMDVLQSRQEIKQEFGMYHTLFRAKGNNPLKFSTDVKDALHNLFVKQNPAYLTPVDAFADAFDDLRDHQLAMLAGMRAGFEAMLAEFDPNHLQQEFERQPGKAGLPLIPAKLRYWDLYRDRAGEMMKDQEAAFSRLFGDNFKRAYEEQFRQLKAQRGSRTAGDAEGREEG
jgi:type VI secretion system FHA domain protein